MDVIEEWEKIYGQKFMEKIGIKPGDIVIDFGCSIGHYALVLAQTVGSEGFVFAIDNDEDPLENLKKKINNTELVENIQIIHSDKIPDVIGEETVDFVLLYDVLHFLEPEHRIELYHSIYSVLKSVTGILSIHPKHTKDDDFPVWNFKDMTTKDVVMEVERLGGFLYERRIDDILWHSEGIMSSSVYNFIKKTK